MREAYTDQLESLFTDLADTADLVTIAVGRATQALWNADGDLAEQVITADAEIDREREALEERAFLLLSLQQPVAGDLRTIVAALRMVSELERMGDLSVHVAKIARRRLPENAVPEQLRSTIDQMAQAAMKMTQEAAQVIRTRDVERARSVFEHDDEVDELRRESFRTMLGHDWEHGVESAVDMALLGRYYERIADHAVSVANRLVYIVTGQTPHTGED